MTPREVHIEFVVGYDADELVDVFTVDPFDDEDPTTPLSLLVDVLTSLLSSAALTVESLRRCEVDVLTVDFRPVPPGVHPDAF